MDVYEATRIILSRIQSLDPENASKIMGLLLLQDHGEKEMIRLAFGTQNLLHSVIANAKKQLGLFGSTLNPASSLFELEDTGFGWGQCSYLCQNGGNCKFVHGGVEETFHGVGSPVMDECKDLLRSKSVPPRLAHQFTGVVSRFPFYPRGLALQQHSEAQRNAAFMMGDDLQKLGRRGPEKIDLSAMACPASRQIYLTFPAESVFSEEDVSNYFSNYGPVQDVRIPYQQKRMFGFVTFVYSETVKSILEKGNPHFVCDSRVLVKPYKEKGKVPDKYRTKPSPDGIPNGHDSRDIMDLQLGEREFHDNTNDLLFKRRFEEPALELQSRRLMNLQLLDVKTHFQLSSPNPPGLDKSHVSVKQRENEKGRGREESDEKDTIKLPESLEEDRLPESPFASPTHHFLVATEGSDSWSPSFDQDESTRTFKSINCQMPSLPLMGMLPGRGGPTCRVGI